MDSMEFRAFLDWLMCSDPWPVIDDDGNERGHDAIVRVANRYAIDWGFTDWVTAYHKHVA